MEVISQVGISKSRLGEELRMYKLEAGSSSKDKVIILSFAGLSEPNFMKALEPV